MSTRVDEGSDVGGSGGFDLGLEAPPSGGDPRGELAWFVSDLRDVLRSELISQPDLVGGPAAAEEMLDGLADLDGVVDTAVAALREPGGDPPPERLRQAGLTGVRLAQKLGAYRGAKETYYEARDRLSGAQNYVASLTERLRKPKRFKRILRRANIILGSLASIFPVIEPFKEYKEAAEASVEEAIEDTEEQAETA